MLELNPQLIENVLVRFIADSIHKNGFENGIVGVSGGIDSAVVLALTCKALGPDQTFALLMPYKTSSPESLEHGQGLCESLGVHYEIIEITPMIDAYFGRCPSENPLAIGNKCARERMSILYDHSLRKHALVVGTSNKSETLIGYCTLYGDSAAAFLPIGDLYKTQIFPFALHLGIPEEIINKKPSADLWLNQTDEGEIGLTYAELDEILYCLVDQRKSRKEMLAEGFDAAKLDTVAEKIIHSQYKRTMPPIVKIHPRTVGIDFRYLRDWNR